MTDFGSSPKNYQILIIFGYDQKSTYPQTTRSTALGPGRTL